MIPPLYWRAETAHVDLLDQTRLPLEEIWLPIQTPEAMAEAIRRLQVRGAPAIGIAAAYGVVLALREEGTNYRNAADAVDLLAATRPTAVNLFYTLRRMRAVLERNREQERVALMDALLQEARQIEEEDRDAGIKLGEYGLSLFEDGMTILTHCHTGGVATSGYGTALAPFILGKERGVALSAYVDETRPLLQGSRITAWELQKSGVPATVITDSMAAHVMKRGLVQAVIVGADRIAANGDTANKIGTYGLAVLAKAHGIPFYVSAPLSTVDLTTSSGDEIEIEERRAEEVVEGLGRRTAPEGIDVFNPAFDVTPGELITAIITEKGIVRAPYLSGLRQLKSEGTDEQI